MVAEAGGRYTDMKGGPHTLRSPHLLADNGAIHDQLLEIFGEIFEGRPRYALP